MTPPPTVTFYDHYVPSLKDGEYTVAVGQSLAVDVAATHGHGGDPGVPEAPHPEVRQTFVVRGPRFVLDPADVHRAFPPPGATGLYHEYLPMVVFNKRALPWERPFGDDPATPWLALVVFADDELPPANGDASSTNPTRSASVPLREAIHVEGGPADGVLRPTLALDDDEDPDQIRVNVIDVPVARFAELMPSAADLPFLAHVREVTTHDKEPLRAAQDGWFSVALANRFAVAPADARSRRNVAHVVSLEGFEAFLGPDAPTAPPGVDAVRMISLYSWTFECLKDPAENFRELMLDLTESASEQGTELRLRMPVPPGAPPPGTDAERAAATRLRDGYVGVRYATRSGAATFAWYRGPLAPVPVTRALALAGPSEAPNARVPRTVAEAMVYDPALGLFDVSYAVAFQTGRSLALGSRPFATGLLQWRRQTHALVDRLAEALRSPLLRDALTRDGVHGAVTDAGAEALAALLDGDPFPGRVRDLFTSDLFGDVARRVGKPGGFGPDRPGGPAAPALAAALGGATPGDLRTLLAQPAVAALIRRLSGLAPDGAPGTPTLSPRLVEWLAERALLYGVPFDNLVPDARMLPDGSIRFFYVDRNWTAALLDGALSVGIQSSRDGLVHRLLRDPLHRAVDRAVGAVRGRLLGAPTGEAAPERLAGFVLRSAVVSGWPGLEVRGWTAGGAPMKPLRLDRVSPSVMVCLFPDVPARVTLSEPSEGLVFGVEDTGIDLRHIPGSDGTTADTLGAVDAGKRIKTADVPTRTSGGAVRIAGADGLAEAIRAGISAPPLTPASFAVEMVRVPEQMLFTPRPA